MIRSYKIISDNSVYCEPHPKLMEKIIHLFRYTRIARWKKQHGTRKLIPVIEESFMLGKYSNRNKFFIGFLPIVREYCKKNNIYTRVVLTEFGQINKIRPTKKAKLENITFREDQKRAIFSVYKSKIGRIVAPTRSGKTIVQLGIASMFPYSNTLLLAHTRDLVKQLGEEAKKYEENLPPIYSPKGSKQIRMILKKIERSSSLVICTIQSLAKISVEDYSHLFDIIMVDECHHVNKINSQYGKVLTGNKPARRYGFTATLPSNKNQEMFNQAMFGNVISELSYDEAINKKIIAKPKVEIFHVNFEPSIIQNLSSESGYSKYYTHCIVNNITRNRLIAKRIKFALAFHHPALIIVEKIEHGQEIRKALAKEINIIVPFARGETKSIERENMIKKIREGKQLVTICSRIWMEGMTMQNLKLIIYAAGLKDQKRVLQAMGRGLGTTKDKSTITLVDFYDPYKFVKRHSIIRRNIYKNKGWKVNEYR